MEPDLDGRQRTDDELVQRLRDGDESAFEQLVRRLHPAMLRTARGYVPSHAVAEEVVQETWAAVLTGLHRFEGRSSLKTWIFRILLNRARTQGVRERRTAPMSALIDDDHGPSVDPVNFLPSTHPHHPGHWSTAPSALPASPEDHAVNAEMHRVVVDTIASLTPRQRSVITLRDVEGWSATEVCDALGLSEGNQRVLLHRARTAVRAALEQRFATVAVGAASAS